MKSRLPPLYQSQQQNDVSNTAFTDLTRKMDLINKARITATTVELNEIIKELYDIYQNDDEIFSTLNQTIQIKKNQLFVDKEKLNRLQSNFTKLKSNTSFLKILENKKLKYQIEELMKSISEVDISRTSFNPPPFTADLKSIINKKENDILKFLHLKELNYRELEALIYLLRKKTLYIDKSSECIESVLKEFNSLSSLIEYEAKLEKENTQLKNFEKVHIQNPMTKRQNFSQLSPYGNQSVAIILQATIQNLYQFSRNNNLHLPMNDGQNFDSICPDLEFNQRELSFKAESPDHNIISLEEAVQITQEQYDKMKSSELLHICFIPQNPSGFNSQFNKLIKSSYNLLDEMRNNHIRYEKAISGISDATKQIMNELTEIRNFDNFSTFTESHLINLNNDHIELIQNQFNNQEKLNTLEKLISTLGISLVFEPNENLKNEVLSHLNFEGQINTQTDKKSRKKSVINLNSSSSFSDNKSALDNELNLLCYQSPNILLSGLDMALKIADLKHSKSKTQKLTELKNSLSDLQNDLSLSINDMNDFLKNKINVLKAANSINLRKELIEIETEVDLTTKIDQCTQTEDNSNKKK